MIKKKAYIGAEIFDGNERHLKAALVLDRNKVCKIIPQVDLEPCCEVTSLAGGLICPGFVDIQVNGGGGYLLNDDPCLEKLEIICDTHAKLGTTAVLPTLISDLPDVTRAAHDCAIAASEKKVPGFCGLHLEGPHLAYSRNGAHDKSVIRPMDENDCLDLEELAHKIPKVLTTVASEAVSTEYIRRLTSAGIIVSLGHSDCSFSRAQELVAAGATGVTHLFNAMSQFGSREPGLVGAALEIGQLSASLIADGFHVDVATINTALRAKKSPGTIFLISDSMSTTGTELKSFELNGRKILRKNGQLTLENGTLAGADLDLASAVRFMVHEVGICQN
ncbi:MAG: N-acetylglucosamine-6-phosphate deacetylase, partial [Paracoccaceae bacterium]|nr:N-acetylglucosamine-6-phosphate deacetylase [Paracoccaceae bacterium]